MRRVAQQVDQAEASASSPDEVAKHTAASVFWGARSATKAERFIACGNRTRTRMPSCSAATDDHVPLISEFSMHVMVVSAVCGVVVLYLGVILQRPPVRDSHRGPRYAVGGSEIITAICVGYIFVFLPRVPLAMFLVGTGLKPDLGCVLGSGSRIVMYSVLSSVLFMLAVSPIRLWARYSLARDLGLDSLPESPTVLVVRSVRGLLIPPLARAVAPIGGRVIGVDMYGTRHCDARKAWADENMAREGQVVHLHTELRAAASMARLPVRDASADLAILHFALYLPWANDSRIPKAEQEQRLFAALFAARRALKPGGQLVATGLFWQGGRIKHVLERAGFSHVRRLSRRYYWFTLYPSLAFVCASAGPAAGDILRLAGSYADAVAGSGEGAPLDDPSPSSSALLLDPIAEEEEEEEEETAAASALPTGSDAPATAYVEMGALERRTGRVLTASHTAAAGGNAHSQLRVQAALAGASLAVFVAATAGLCAAWNALSVPRALVWQDRVGTNLAKNLAVMPSLFAGLHQQLSAYCRPWDRGLRRETVPAARVVRTWVRYLLWIALAAILWNSFLWLPAFLVGWRLTTASGLQADDIATYSHLATVAIASLLVPVVRALYTRHQRRRDRILTRRRARAIAAARKLPLRDRAASDAT